MGRISRSGAYGHLTLPIALGLLISGCGGSSGSDGIADTDSEADQTVTTTTVADQALRTLIEDRGLTPPDLAARDLPSIDDPLPQLGLQLFYSKSLGGGFDSACASCHHPVLGGGDGLSLPVGTDAVNAELLGPGREHSSGLPPVPRNAPTVFNSGLWDTGLFLDLRVESIGQETNANGALSGIRTPDSTFGVADPDAGGTGSTLPAAQARFPVTESDEMKTDAFENGSSNSDIRDHLAGRLGNYGTGAGELISNDWLAQFREAYGTTADAETLITFEHIAEALGEFERSMLFVDNPWFRYLEGDELALSNSQKRGAQLFFTPTNQGGAGCAACHNGPLFSDGQTHTVAFPQFGPGKGDGSNDDFGRERETGDSDDRYEFRTLSLLNVAKTGPYGHAGTYQNLQEVIRHYINPNRSVTNFFADGGACLLPQFADLDDCEELYPDSPDNSQEALDKLRREQQRGESQLVQPRLNQDEINDLEAFLEALTDPCVESRDCLAPWIADDEDDPDDQVLIAVDRNGNEL